MTLHNIKQLKKDNGFTIIELLIVIIVIGILATLVLVGYNNIQGQASATKRQADAGSLRDSAAAYKVASVGGNYPTNTPTGFQTDITTSSNYPTGITAPLNLDQGITAKISSATVVTAANADTNYTVTYCGPSGTAPTATTATGMKIYYWGNGALAAVTTGTNTGATQQSASVAGCNYLQGGL